MQTLKAIRTRLNLTQEALGVVIGVTKARVSQLESGQGEIGTDAARRLIEHASQAGIDLSFDDIYRRPAATQQQVTA